MCDVYMSVCVPNTVRIKFSPSPKKMTLKKIDFYFLVVLNYVCLANGPVFLLWGKKFLHRILSINPSFNGIGLLT